LMNRAWVACVWRVAPPNCATTPSSRLSIWGSRGAPRQHHLPAIHCRPNAVAAHPQQGTGCRSMLKSKLKWYYHRGK
jgi:hypothetical protein